MSNPECIHIVLNAADGFDRFLACGMQLTRSEDLSVSKITTMLSAQSGRLFRLMGWIDSEIPAVTLKIAEADKDQLLLVSDEPPIAGQYRVADEPPPWVSVHGDYFFDLIST
jgi:hypothetical protein